APPGERGADLEQEAAGHDALLREDVADLAHSGAPRDGHVQGAVAAARKRLEQGDKEPHQRDREADWDQPEQPPSPGRKPPGPVGGRLRGHRFALPDSSQLSRMRAAARSSSPAEPPVRLAWLVVSRSSWSSTRTPAAFATRPAKARATAAWSPSSPR